MKKFFANRYVRAVLVIILSVIFMELGGAVGSLPMLPLLYSNNAVLAFVAQYAAFIGIWILVIVFLLIRKKDRKLLSKLGRGSAGNKWKPIVFIGIPCGIGLNLFCAWIAMLHGDIQLSYSAFNPWMVLLFIVVVMIQSGAEELVDRMYLYQKISELFPEIPVLPIIVNPVVFALVHIFNPGVTPLAILNIFLVGILYSLIIYYFDSFWAVVLAHTGWNFCQNIILGLPNSGAVSVYSIFKLDASTAVNSFAYNVNFGIEGTVLSSAVIVAACVVIVLIGRKKKKAAGKA